MNNPQRPWRAGPGAPTILMVNNRHDPSTGYVWALGAHSQAPAKTSLFTYEGWGHGVYLIRGDCVNDAVGQYLIRLTLPGAGCPV